MPPPASLVPVDILWLVLTSLQSVHCWAHGFSFFPLLCAVQSPPASLLGGCAWYRVCQVRPEISRTVSVSKSLIESHLQLFASAIQGKVRTSMRMWLSLGEGIIIQRVTRGHDKIRKAQSRVGSTTHAHGIHTPEGIPQCCGVDFPLCSHNLLTNDTGGVGYGWGMGEGGVEVTRPLGKTDLWGDPEPVHSPQCETLGHGLIRWCLNR